VNVSLGLARRSLQSLSPLVVTQEMTVGVYSGLDVLKQTYSIYMIDDNWILGMFDLTKPDPALTETA
jgi:hypothetical protein